MDTLQLSLLIAGFVIVGGIYLFYRQTRDRADGEIPPAHDRHVDPLLDDEIIRAPDRHRVDPDIELAQAETVVATDDVRPRAAVPAGTHSIDSPSREPRPAPGAARHGNASAPGAAMPGYRQQTAPEFIVLLHLVARERHKFRGTDVVDAIGRNGLVLGDGNIFHYVAPGQSGHTPMYSIANMLEPGSFDLDTIDRFETPGLVLFMALPGETDGKTAFEKMLQTARRLADTLDGELKDESRSVLTLQGIEHIQERIGEYQRKRRLASRRAVPA